MSVIFLGTSAQAIAFDRNDIDVIHYGLDYKLDLSHAGWEVGDNRLSGSVTIRFRNLADDDLLSLPLVAGRLLRITRADDADGHSLVFTQRLQEFDDRDFYQANVIEVKLLQPLASGAEALVRLELNGRIIGYPEAGMLYTREAMDPAFTIIRSETLAYPAIAAPNWTSIRKNWQDKFDWSASVEVPGSLVVANGAPGKVVQKDTDTVYQYKSARPNSFFNLPVGPYKVIQVSGNRIFYLPGSETGAQRVSHYMQKALDYYTNLMGPLRESSGLAIIEIPQWFGSQASFPTIIQTADAFDNEDDMGQLFHELSHLWQAHDPDSHSPRIEEGLSTFFQYLAADKLQGTDQFTTVMDGILARSKSVFEDNPGYREIAVKDYGEKGVTDLSYRVGALFYFVLYNKLGEEAFMELMAGHRKTFQENGCSIEELAAYYQAKTKIDIQSILEDWLFSRRYVGMIMKSEKAVDLLAAYAP